MTAKAVTACRRSSADIDTALGSRTTTTDVRRSAPDMPRTTSAQADGTRPLVATADHTDSFLPAGMH
jgi:hypothetical protein